MTTSKNSKRLSPLMQVKTARNLLIFTIYICNGIEKGIIPPELFNETLQLQEDGKPFGRVRPLWKTTNLSDDVHNLRVGMLGVCCIALNTALDETFDKKPEKYTNSDIDALRAIIYMFRCAFAHNPILPVWDVSKKHQRQFSISELDLEMDFTTLNGQGVNGSQYGGWEGVFKLIDYCMKAVESKSK